LPGRVESLTKDEIDKLVDVNIMIKGIKIKETSNLSLMCVLISTSLCIFPFVCMFLRWWKKYTYPAYDIPLTIYETIAALLRAPNLRNLTLCVLDNQFD
jgi:uncharacterized protein with PQ loop repeat